MENKSCYKIGLPGTAKDYTDEAMDIITINVKKRLKRDGLSPDNAIFEFVFFETEEPLPLESIVEDVDETDDERKEREFLETLAKAIGELSKEGVIEDGEYVAGDLDSKNIDDEFKSKKIYIANAPESLEQ